MKTVTAPVQAGKYDFAHDFLLEAALRYAARGWCVIPLHSPLPQGCSCGKGSCRSEGKHPRTPGGSKDASCDPIIIRSWWHKWPDANVGIVTGEQSSLWVLDVDGEDGCDSLTTLQALGIVPATLRAETGRKGPDGIRVGFHLYFNWPKGARIRNSTGLIGKGLDVRGNGGYVVAPPSLHASGLRYCWADEKASAVEATESLLARVAQLPPMAVFGSKPKAVREGERDNTLYRRAAKSRREGMTKDQIQSALFSFNRRFCEPPLDEVSVVKIAKSAARLPADGLDPLELAWEKAKVENHPTTYGKFLALIKHLDHHLGATSILLPVEKVGNLIGCDHVLVGRHRKRAVRDSLIKEVERYIPHHKATRFIVLKSSAIPT